MLHSLPYVCVQGALGFKGKPLYVVDQYSITELHQSSVPVFNVSVLPRGHVEGILSPSGLER